MHITLTTLKYRLAASLVLMLAILGLAASAAPAEARDWKASSWMGDLFANDGKIKVKGQIKPALDVELGQLAIPGSHDSTAFNMGEFADECQAPDFFQRNFGRGLTERYARTEHHDLYTQAKLGIRSFDIRPYYDGKQLRTCHTLDAGTLKSAFEGDGGLNRFLDEEGGEVVIVNLAHFRPEEGSSAAKHAKGIEAIAEYLRDNVCRRALDPSDAPKIGTTSLRLMYDKEKDYILVADDDQGLYTKLQRRLGEDKCVYKAKDQISGGYAGEKSDVELGNGETSSTNLWIGMINEVLCRGIIMNCEQDRNANHVRRATEKVLLDDLRGDRKALHETSYIWSYGQFAGFDNWSAAYFRANLNDSSLIGATDRTRLVADKGIVKDIYVRAGLKAYSKDFINRLERAGDRDKTGVGVNVVNMDAIGRDDTFEPFVKPLISIDEDLLLKE